MKRFTLTVVENDDGELFINIPEDLANDLSWRDGTKLEYDDEGDGTLLVYKLEEYEYCGARVTASSHLLL